MILRGSRRKGIDALLVELILFLVSIVAAVALNSFYLGVANAYVHPAEVAASSVICTSSGSNESCSVTLTNIGSASTHVISCSIGGSPADLAVGGEVPAGGSTVVVCRQSGTPPQPGSSVSGSIALANLGMVYFIGSA